MGNRVGRCIRAFRQGDPAFMRRTNGYLAVAWVGMIPISFFMQWLTSVMYVSALSLWALVSAHWAAWAAAHGEIASREDTEQQTEELIRRIVLEVHGLEHGQPESMKEA